MKSEHQPYGLRGKRFDRGFPVLSGRHALPAGVAFDLRGGGVRAPLHRCLILVGAAACSSPSARARGVGAGEPQSSAMGSGHSGGRAGVRVSSQDRWRPDSALVRWHVSSSEQAPRYLHRAQNHSTMIGRINEALHVQQRIAEMFHSSAHRGRQHWQSRRDVLGAVSRSVLWLCSR